ncbi:MAG: RHS repeat-associated core domain-containing protein, partial [Phycisphaerae bacterium]
MASNAVNEYTTVCGTTVLYDDAGNLIQDKSGYQYAYDYENRLTQIARPDDTVVATFAYDALGRRIERVDTIAGTTTRFYYDDQRIVLQDGWHLQAPGLWVEDDSRTFIFGNYIDEVLVMSVIPAQGAIQDYYYGHDHLYSPVALFESDGDLVERYEYDVYGSVRVLTSNFSLLPSSQYGNLFFFTGRELDSFDCTPPAAGCTLYYYRARSYDPQTGRFLQRDPLGVNPADIFLPRIQYLDGNNVYEYCESNAVVFADPMGTMCQVFYSCAFVRETSLGTFMKQCDYKCVENKLKHREDHMGGSLDCDDPRIPTVVNYSYSTLFCSKCPKTRDYTKIWREGEFPDPTNCSCSGC